MDVKRRSWIPVSSRSVKMFLLVNLNVGVVFEHLLTAFPPEFVV